MSAGRKHVDRFDKKIVATVAGSSGGFGIPSPPGSLRAVPEPEDLPWSRPLGAFPRPDGLVEIRVWAPHAAEAAVRIGGADHRLEDAGLGVREGLVPGAAGADYLIVLDGTPWPDPFSRWQPEGVRGPSRVLDAASFTWSDAGWRTPRLDELVVYELHVGTFTPEGTFDAAAASLPELAELGVTAVELMPVATFPGRFGWGYDGLYAFAPHPAYGGPEGLARLVDAAHRAGIAVILDVVYNHLGPGNEAIEAFGPWFTDRYGTLWGRALNYDDSGCGAVREWAIQNALMWVEHYRIDGLRLDAVHAIHDSGARHLLAELTDRVHASRPDTLLIAESDLNDPRVIRPVHRGGLGMDAAWADDFHHALHALLSGERDGYYADFGRVGDLARAFRRPFVHAGDFSGFRGRRHGAPAADRPPRQFVVCSQNHDQVGNRAVGDRPGAHGLRLAAFCTILSPFVPLIFMGEEDGSPRPFVFFADHIDPEIARLTREGRRREFATFTAFADEVPDPGDPGSVERSTLRPGDRDHEMRRFLAALIGLRREIQSVGGPEAITTHDEEARWMRVTRGDVELLMNLSDNPLALPAGGRQVVALATHPTEVARGLLTLAPWAAVALR